MMRSQNLLRTASLDTIAPATASESIVTEEETASDTPKIDTDLTSNKVSEVQLGESSQLTVDVTLILSDSRDTTRYGVNLLESLQGIYSAARESSLTQTGEELGVNTTTITRAIKVPDIAYNLNIFNKGGRYYEVIARPSLTAFAGEQSTFFVGEQLKVPVGGVNSASLETIDVGVSLKITPNQIRNDGAQFRVEADRSFFSDQGIGRFAEGVALFKQSVAATADVHFGETLILSGLSESVADGNGSAVPILGDIPLVNSLFSNDFKLHRGRSVLILVTPSLPSAFTSSTNNMSSALNTLTQIWDKVIEPRHGVDALAKQLQKRRTFTRAVAGDLPSGNIRDSRILEPLLNSIGFLNTPSDNESTH